MQGALVADSSGGWSDEHKYLVTPEPEMSAVGMDGVQWAKVQLVVFRRI